MNLADRENIEVELFVLALKLRFVVTNPVEPRKASGMIRCRAFAKRRRRHIA